MTVRRSARSGATKREAPADAAPAAPAAKKAKVSTKKTTKEATSAVGMHILNL
jgi:hypothetical protein